MNRLKTVFLTPTTSFLHGFGSVMNLSGRHYRYPFIDSDEAALAKDWMIVGEDLQDALDKAYEELSHRAHERAA